MYGIPGNIISLALLIGALIARYKLFQKLGKEGWTAIVPFYNKIVYGQLAGSTGLGVAWMILSIFALPAGTLLFLAAFYAIMIGIFNGMLGLSYIATMGEMNEFLELEDVLEPEVMNYMIPLLIIAAIVSISFTVIKFLVFSKLCERYNVSKWFAVLFIITQNITEMICGFSDRIFVQNTAYKQQQSQWNQQNNQYGPQTYGQQYQQQNPYQQTYQQLNDQNTQ